MKKKIFGLLSPFLLLVAGCANNNLPSVPEDIVNTYETKPETIDPIMPLPGINRDVFSESIEALATNITCKIEDTGLLYREQSRVQPNTPINFFRGTVRLPSPRKYLSRTTGGRVVGNIYIGGDTLGLGGQLDAGFASDNVLGNTYYRAFILNKVGEKDKASDGFIYRMNGNQNVDVSLFIDKGNNIHLIINGNLLRYNSVNGTPQPVTGVRDIVQQSFPGTWNYNGLNQVIKNMTTVAVDYPSDFSVDSTTEFPAASWDKNSMVVGYRTQQQFDGNVKDLKSFINSSSPSDKKWDSFLSESPCASPDDSVKPTGSNSATITLRTKSSLSYNLLPENRTGNFVNGFLRVKNSGRFNSKLYYNITLPGQSKAKGDILTGQSKDLPYSYTCPNKNSGQDVNLYYSKNETFDEKNPKDMQPPPPFDVKEYGLDKNGKAILLSSGALLFRTQVINVKYNCTKQSFQIPPTTLTALVNQSTPETTQNLTVISDSATVSGQYLVGPKAALAAQSIIVNADPVTPVIPTPFQAKDLLVTVKPIKCGPTAGTNAPLNSTISDPTGNTDPTDYAVTVRCVGPAISDPTPNPLNLSGTVGSPVTGTFTFQNVGEVVNGAQAPLTFSLSPSAGLTASAAPASPLAGGGTATVTVGATCEVAGTKTYTVTITSDDVNNPTLNTRVVVICAPPDVNSTLTFNNGLNQTWSPIHIITTANHSRIEDYSLYKNTLLSVDINTITSSIADVPIDYEIEDASGLISGNSLIAGSVNSQKILRNHFDVRCDLSQAGAHQITLKTRSSGVSVRENLFYVVCSPRQQMNMHHPIKFKNSLNSDLSINISYKIFSLDDGAQNISNPLSNVPSSFTTTVASDVFEHSIEYKFSDFTLSKGGKLEITPLCKYMHTVEGSGGAKPDTISIMLNGTNIVSQLAFANVYCPVTFINSPEYEGVAYSVDYEKFDETGTSALPASSIIAADLNNLEYQIYDPNPWNMEYRILPYPDQPQRGYVQFIAK